MNDWSKSVPSQKEFWQDKLAHAEPILEACWCALNPESLDIFVPFISLVFIFAILSYWARVLVTEAAFMVYFRLKIKKDYEFSTFMKFIKMR